MLHLPTISGLQRAVACTAAVVLEQDSDDGQSAAALRGSRIHGYVAARFRMWPLPNIGKTKVGHIQLGKLRRQLGHGELRAELAMAYDGKRVHVIGENVQRAAYLSGEVNGAADLVVLRDDALVCDVKTGARDVEPPQGNWQLATLALFVSMAYSVKSVTGLIAKLGRDGKWTFAEHRWSLDDLAVVRQRLDAKVREWRGEQSLYDAGLGEPVRSPNGGCYFCRAIGCEHARVKAVAA